MKRALTVTVLVCAVVTSSWVPASASPNSDARESPTPRALPACISAPFADVLVDHPFCAEILWASGQGITTGYAGNMFRPTGLVARQAVAAFLWRIEGSPEPSSTGTVFGDVPFGHPFFSSIQWMGQTGMSTGTSDPLGGLPSFKPSDSISRLAMAAFLWRLADMPAPAASGQIFADVPASHPFFPAIQWMGQTGLSNGSSNPQGGKRLFLPADPITRQATMVFLARYDAVTTPIEKAFRLFYVRPAGSAAVPARPAQIVSQVNAARTWFAGQLGGVAPLVTGADGVPAVTSVVLPWTQAQISGLADAQQSINDHLDVTYGLAGQRMVTWLEGTVDESYCGVWDGTSMFLPMDNCGIYPAEGAVFPYNGTYLLVHELTHALGAVPSCAPHFDGTGHVNDDPRDVLYDGPLPRDWDNLMLDPGRDDYYPFTSGACPSIADSVHLGPLALP